MKSVLKFHHFLCDDKSLFVESSSSDENLDDPVDDFNEGDDAATNAQSEQTTNVGHKIGLGDSLRLFIF